ncbi:MAG: PEGA domain-containing protein [Proteobacteria bacterium]|nr:PEGA domain-containing protein [Pseudomonadota bacterium]
MTIKIQVLLHPFLFFTFAMLQTGCASLFNWHGDQLQINSEPQGATVRIDKDRAVCVTPCDIILDPKDSYKFVASLEDYNDVSSEVTRRPAAWFYVNAVGVTYGFIGAGIDWLTGRMWTWSRQRTIVFSDEDSDEDDDEVEEEVTPDEPADESAKPVIAVPASRPIVPKPDLPTSTPQPKSAAPMPPERPDDLHTRYTQEAIVRKIEWIGGLQSPSELKRLVGCVYADLRQNGGGSSIHAQDVRKTLDSSVRRALNGLIDLCDE